eukprot:g1473.t1
MFEIHEQGLLDSYPAWPTITVISSECPPKIDTVLPVTHWLYNRAYGDAENVHWKHLDEIIEAAEKQETDFQAKLKEHRAGGNPFRRRETESDSERKIKYYTEPFEKDSLEFLIYHLLPVRVDFGFSECGRNIEQLKKNAQEYLDSKKDWFKKFETETSAKNFAANVNDVHIVRLLIELKKTEKFFPPKEGKNDGEASENMENAKYKLLIIVEALNFLSSWAIKVGEDKLATVPGGLDYRLSARLLNNSGIKYCEFMHVLQRIYQRSCSAGLSPNFWKTPYKMLFAGYSSLNYIDDVHTAECCMRAETIIAAKELVTVQVERAYVMAAVDPMAVLLTNAAAALNKLIPVPESHLREQTKKPWIFIKDLEEAGETMEFSRICTVSTQEMLAPDPEEARISPRPEKRGAADTTVPDMSGAPILEQMQTGDQQKGKGKSSGSTIFIPAGKGPMPTHFGMGQSDPLSKLTPMGWSGFGNPQPGAGQQQQQYSHSYMNLNAPPSQFPGFYQQPQQPHVGQPQQQQQQQQQPGLVADPLAGFYENENRRNHAGPCNVQPEMLAMVGAFIEEGFEHEYTIPLLDVHAIPEELWEFVRMTLYHDNLNPRLFRVVHNGVREMIAVLVADFLNSCFVYRQPRHWWLFALTLKSTIAVINAKRREGKRDEASFDLTILAINGWLAHEFFNAASEQAMAGKYTRPAQKDLKWPNGHSVEKRTLDLWMKIVEQSQSEHGLIYQMFGYEDEKKYNELRMLLKELKSAVDCKSSRLGLDPQTADNTAAEKLTKKYSFAEILLVAPLVVASLWTHDQALMYKSLTDMPANTGVDMIYRCYANWHTEVNAAKKFQNPTPAPPGGGTGAPGGGGNKNTHNRIKHKPTDDPTDTPDEPAATRRKPEGLEEKPKTPFQKLLESVQRLIARHVEITVEDMKKDKKFCTLHAANALKLFSRPPRSEIYKCEFKDKCNLCHTHTEQTVKKAKVLIPIEDKSKKGGDEPKGGKGKGKPEW